MTTKETTKNPVLYTFEEAARLLGGVSHWTLRRHLKRGNIRIVRLGQRVFLDAKEIERIRRSGLPPLTEEKRTCEA